MNPERREFLRRTMYVAAAVGMFPHGASIAETWKSETYWVVLSSHSFNVLQDDLEVWEAKRPIVSGEVGRVESFSVYLEV